MAESFGNRHATRKVWKPMKSRSIAKIRPIGKYTRNRTNSIPPGHLKKFRMDLFSSIYKFLNTVALNITLNTGLLP